MIDIMLAQQLQQNQNLVPFEGVMRKFFNKYLSFERVKEEYIGLYTEAFTIDELKALNAFYSTPAGRKAVKLLPTLMQKGGEIGARRVQENIGELQQMIADEARKQQEKQQSEDSKTETKN